MKDFKTEAKTKMLQELKKMATDMMGGDLKSKMDGMKKVTVAAKDESGLEKGLDKAKEIVGHEGSSDLTDGLKAALGGHTEESEPEDEATEGDEMSPEEMKEKIAELQAQLEMMKK